MECRGAPKHYLMTAEKMNNLSSQIHHLGAKGLFTNTKCEGQRDRKVDGTFAFLAVNGV